MFAASLPNKDNHKVETLNAGDVTDHVIPFSAKIGCHSNTMATEPHILWFTNHSLVLETALKVQTAAQPPGASSEESW